MPIFFEEIEFVPTAVFSDAGETSEAGIGDTVRMYLHEIGHYPLLTVRAGKEPGASDRAGRTCQGLSASSILI